MHIPLTTHAQLRNTRKTHLATNKHSKPKLYLDSTVCDSHCVTRRKALGACTSRCERIQTDIGLQAHNAGCNASMPLRLEKTNICAQRQGTSTKITKPRKERKPRCRQTAHLYAKLTVLCLPKCRESGQSRTCILVCIVSAPH